MAYLGASYIRDFTVVTFLQNICFTHCSLLTPYGDIDQSQHWHRQWQAITRTNVDLSLKVFCGIHLRAISQGLTNLIHNMHSEIAQLKSLPHLLGADELFLMTVEWPALDAQSHY